jgi:hypothetical protein
MSNSLWSPSLGWVFVYKLERRRAGIHRVLSDTSYYTLDFALFAYYLVFVLYCLPLISHLMDDGFSINFASQLPGGQPRDVPERSFAMQASKLLVDLVRLPRGSSAATDQHSKRVA